MVSQRKKKLGPQQSSLCRGARAEHFEGPPHQGPRFSGGPTEELWSPSD